MSGNYADPSLSHSLQDGWTIAPLSHFLSRITYGFTNPMPTTADGPFMVTAKDIHDGKIDYSTARHTSDDAYRRALTDKSRPKTGDVLLTKDGSIGRVAVCDRENICINQSVAVLQPNLRIKSKFLKYLLESPYYQQRMDNDADGSTIKHIYITRVDKMHVAVPSLPEQDTIISVLGALDDKIDLNRRMNETLEAMARAIFKDWFIDFGPTRAKMEGRAPYLAPEIWSLFPDLLDNEGKPQGWTDGKLLDICELKRGYDLPTANRRPGRFPIVSSSGVSGAHDQSMARSPGVVTGRYGTVGEVFFLDEDFWPLNTALYVRDFKGNEPRYIYYTLRGIDFGIYSDKGAVPGLNRNHLHQHPIVRVPLDIQRGFAAMLEPVWARQQINASESETLAATRDLLLPKLMSGEIRVREADKIAEAAQ